MKINQKYFNFLFPDNYEQSSGKELCEKVAGERFLKEKLDNNSLVFFIHIVNDAIFDINYGVQSQLQRSWQEILINCDMMWCLTNILFFLWHDNQVSVSCIFINYNSFYLNIWSFQAEYLHCHEKCTSQWCIGECQKGARWVQRDTSRLFEMIAHTG